MNKRLIGLVEAVIIEYVQKIDPSYIIKDSNVIDAPLEDLIEMDG